MHRLKINIVFLLIVLLNLASNKVCAQYEIPSRIQAALLNKVLKFSHNHTDKKNKVLIIYNPKTRKVSNELNMELKNDMEVKMVMSTAIPGDISSYNVVYFMPGLQEKTSICKNKKILSVSCVQKYAENGKTSLAFGLVNNKPKIYINMSSLKEEEQSFSADILRIAKVYK